MQNLNRQYYVRQYPLFVDLELHSNLTNGLSYTKPSHLVQYPKKYFLKSPLNYIGGKYKILSQIIPLFPKHINTFIDMFAGGCNVAINTQAKYHICNDNLVFLIDLYNSFKSSTLQEILCHIEAQIDFYNLSLINKEGYIALRQAYNKCRNPLDLFVLMAYSFNHQIRFNSKHEFNNPFGKERSSYNKSMKENLIAFIHKLKSLNIVFQCSNFTDFPLESLKEGDFLYCDPPYFITNATYNDGKRGFTGWSKNEEFALYAMLDRVNKQNIPFALSNVLEDNGLSNDILKSWVKQSHYHINFLNADYSHSNYQKKSKRMQSVEVLITNYDPSKNR